MDASALARRLDRQWDESILPQLVEYVRIPNISPAFDPQWERHGHMERAVELIARWFREQALPGMKVEVHRLPGRTPPLLIDVPGELQGAEDFSPTLRASHRGLRGELECRSSRSSRGTGRSNRPPVVGGLSGRGMRQLRSALVYNVATRRHDWNARHSGAEGWRSFGVGHRDCADAGANRDRASDAAGESAHRQAAAAASRLLEK
jgi:hypothetical protein